MTGGNATQVHDWWKKNESISRNA